MEVTLFFSFFSFTHGGAEKEGALLYFRSLPFFGRFRLTISASFFFKSRKFF